MSKSIYCPICGRDIEPENAEEVELGENGGYIYVHDDIPHEEDDLKSLFTGIQ